LIREEDLTGIEGVNAEAKMIEREKTPANLKSLMDTKINPKKTSIPLKHNIVRQ
jgi:hypothetical protein